MKLQKINTAVNFFRTQPGQFRIVELEIIDEIGRFALITYAAAVTV